MIASCFRVFFFYFFSFAFQHAFVSCDIGTRKRQMLPFGWSQATDEATGKPYYYTFDSVKVQWEVPTEVIPRLKRDTVIHRRSNSRT